MKSKLPSWIRSTNLCIIQDFASSAQSNFTMNMLNEKQKGFIDYDGDDE